MSQSLTRADGSTEIQYGTNRGTRADTEAREGEGELGNIERVEVWRVLPMRFVENRDGVWVRVFRLKLKRVGEDVHNGN